MTPKLIFSILIGYFLLLMLISYLTSRKSDNAQFFLGSRNSKWFVVAFGMIGASLSGVTFISIPGTVANNGFEYMQIVSGYLIGYVVIAFVLMPLYYRLQLTSIYAYLGQRFGRGAYVTGASYFLLSRIIGASLRLFIVTSILQEFLFSHWGVPFAVTVMISIGLIWLYTYRAGIGTIIWTDTLQTLFMLLAAGLAVYLIASDLQLEWGQLFSSIDEAGYGGWWQTTDEKASNYFIKSIVAGAFITICMTGLDQDMMQKNLSCKNIKDAQKNMMTFSFILFFVNIMFLVLGALLFIYMDTHPEVGEFIASKGGDTDYLFPYIALEGELGLTIGVFFLIGLIAAAYSSADSALTSLTTSFCVDILRVDENKEKKAEKTRKYVHVMMSFVLFVVVYIFSIVKNDNVINELFTAAQYTYGPLLGLYFFGMFTKTQVKDKWVPLVCIAAPIASYFINDFLSRQEDWYQFGFELIVLNGLLTVIGLVVLTKPSEPNEVIELK